MPADGTDVVADDGVVYRFFDGQGLQFHPLANASRLNALIAAGGRTRRERSPTRSPTASRGRTAPRSGSTSSTSATRSAPWTSGMAQAVMAQALARVGQARPRTQCLPRDPRHPRPRARSRAVDPPLQQHRRHRPQRPAPERDLDRRLRRARGRRRRRRVRRPAARGREGDAAPLRHRPLVALFAPRRTDLGYQDYVIDLLKTLANRTGDKAWSDAVDAFRLYETQPPMLTAPA